MDAYLRRVLDERLAREGQLADDKVGKKEKRKRVIIDLALQEYQKLQPEEKGRSGGMDEKFERAAITQIRAFIFAGACNRWMQLGLVC